MADLIHSNRPGASVLANVVALLSILASSVGVSEGQQKTSPSIPMVQPAQQADSARAAATPRSPMAGDLRFQLVASPAAANGTYEGLSLTLLYPYKAAYPTALGTPLELGAGECVDGIPQDCAWPYRIHDLPPGVSLSVAYLADIQEKLDADIKALSSDTLVTSLDIESGEDVFALSTQKAASTGFDARHEVTPLSRLQAIADTDGAKSRVITAISFNHASGSVDLLSYGWTSDKATVYDTLVSTAQFENIGPAAKALASSGYTITAFGGNGQDGFVLVGTKAHGDTAPRSLLVSPDATMPLQGYALVGWALNALPGRNPSPPVWLWER